MTTFISDVLQDLYEKGLNLEDLCFILPSRRAGVFLKHQLSQFITKPIFSPEILSIEEFVENLSQLQNIGNTELLFEFYESYKSLTPKNDLDSFESFSKWGQILLQDFNEIDRYLIPQEKIFGYLSAIKDIENQHWSLEENQTDFIKKYLSFWNKLFLYYEHFTDRLLKENLGYQGLIYRKATEHIDSYIEENPKKTHIFLGFNALNTAEESIIQTLLERDLAHIYWDIDQIFIENPIHDAGLFTREQRKSWAYFTKQPFNWITDHYSKKKEISIIGIPQQVGQAKYVGQILKDLHKSEQKLESTAVVLGDENLLIPLLNSFPENSDALNITMGLQLKYIPLASLFQQLFEIHKTNPNHYYYKDVIQIISHAFIKPLFTHQGNDLSRQLINAIHHNNLVYISLDKLIYLAPECKGILNTIFSKCENKARNVIQNCQNLILALKSELSQNKQNNLLALEYLYRFNELFNSLSQLNSEYDHIQSITTLYGLYKELLSSETLDFQGEPLQGLQVMGMLESRVLDFETVIITSVNEGILPAGKTNNSFIPFDVKLENKLPTYKEKDAVYAYHFYRLIQRAKKVYILYNTEADVLTGGEKSRFITQLELEQKHTIKHLILTPKVPISISSPNQIEKTPAVFEKLQALAEKGFSPSTLTNYMRNPIDFYYDKILKIKELDEVEETVEANTLGTVVHNTLEDFYKPLEGKTLTIADLNDLNSQITKTVTHHFKSVYNEGDITKGKNLITFEIAKRYISNFLDLEKDALRAGNTIKIIAIESDLNIPIILDDLDFPIRLKGKVDRVDEYNGIVRVLDYKTGHVQQNQVEVIDWDDLTTDYEKYSKSFQVLSYAFMLVQSKIVQTPFEGGIISFKNLSAGFLKFAKKDRSGRGAQVDSLIAEETLKAYETQLKRLVMEICNPNIPFIEKEV